MAKIQIPLAKYVKEKTTLYLQELDEDSLQRIRQKICQETDALIDRKAHPRARGLLDIIFESHIMDNLSVDQTIKLVELIFPESVQEEGWISKYGFILLRIITENRKKKVDARAAKYEKYMSDVLIPALNAGARTGTVWDDLDRLEDLYKIAVCLYRFYSENDVEFVFDVDLESMEKLNKAVANITIVGGNVIGLKNLLGSAEDRQYATFLSWVLEEMLSKHEGLREGEE